MLPGMSAVMMSAVEQFVSVTHDLDSGTLALTIPTGATGYEIWVLGGGGGSGWSAGSGGGGGGGGGCAYLSGSILSGEWGASLSRTVGALGSNETGASANNATAGGNSTLTGTLGGVSISMTGNGGAATQSAVDASGGSASGGSVNTSGDPGDSSSLPSVGGGPGVDLGGTPKFGTGGGGQNSNAPQGGRIRVKFT